MNIEARWLIILCWIVQGLVLGCQVRGQNEDCGGLLQKCCCETPLLKYDGAAQIMIGMPATDQCGCCTSKDQVCIGTEFRDGDLFNFKCYPKSIIVDRTYIETNSNYKGDSVQASPLSVDSVEACGKKCEELDACNTFVYCGRTQGCRNADIDVVPYKQCDLKFQEVVLQGYLPEAWFKGPDVDFTSGFIRRGVVIEDNANYKGDYEVVYGESNFQATVEDCATSCKTTERCNAFVYCGKKGGCANADINVIKFQRCDLKFQLAIAQGKPPEAWVRGIDTDFTSGYVNRSIPCGYAENAPCCPSTTNSQFTQLNNRSTIVLPGGCNTPDLYCDSKFINSTAQFGLCKKVNKTTVCGAENGICGSTCDDFSQSCPDGFSCGKFLYDGIPGYSVDSVDLVSDMCVKNPSESECGLAGQMCCPYNAQNAPGKKVINAECDDEEGLVCVGADEFYMGTCYDFNLCGKNDQTCCPNLYGQVVKGKASSYAQCKGMRAWCNETSSEEAGICQLNAMNCGRGGAACCYSSPTVEPNPPLCNDGYLCNEQANICVACDQLDTVDLKVKCRKQHCICKPAGCSCTADPA